MAVGGCLVCNHAKLEEIETKALAGGEAWDDLGRAYGTTGTTITRHIQSCGFQTLTYERVMSLRKANQAAARQHAVDLKEALAKVASLEKFKAARSERPKSELFDPEKRDQALLFVLQDLAYLKGWAEDLSEQARNDGNIDVKAQMNMIEGARKLVSTISDVYTSFARLDQTERALASEDDTEAIRGELSAYIRAIKGEPPLLALPGAGTP